MTKTTCLLLKVSVGTCRFVISFLDAQRDMRIHLKWRPPWISSCILFTKGIFVLRWKYYWQLGNTYALCCNFCHSSVGHVICDIHSSETEKYSSQTIGRRFFRPLLWVLMSGYNSIGWETVTLSGGNLIFWAILICCLATRGPKMGRSFWNVDKMLFWYMPLLFTKYEVNRPNGLGGVRGQTHRQTDIHTEELRRL